MNALRQDLQFALRTLARAPGITAVAVLTLALGIGANAAVFSLVNTVLVRPLPFPESDRLTMVFERAHGYDHGNVSGHEFVAWRDQTHSFESLALLNYETLTLTGRGDPVTVKAQSVTAQYFDVLRIRPMLGRVFQRGDDQAGAPLAILGHSLWQTRFAGDSAIVGKRVLLDQQPYDVIGVMGPRGDLDADLWIPMNVVAEAYKVGKHSNLVFGRLKPGVTLAAAESDLELAARRLAEQLPNANKGHDVHVSSLYDEVVGAARRPFYVALGAAAFILLLACANVGHLLLTRAAARQKEMAVRTALGAGRGRLMRQLMTEAFVLSIAGGVIGLFVAVWITDLLPQVSAIRVPRLTELSMDWRVLAATTGFCVCAGLLCGLIPALRASSPRLVLWLNDGARGSAGPGRRAANVLVVSEVAIALVLLIGAGLTIKSFARMTRIDPGFDPRGVIVANLPLVGPSYANAERQRDAGLDLMQRVGSLPGVSAAGATTVLPFSTCCNSMGITIEGAPAPAPGEEIKARMTVVAGRYFEAMRMQLRRGRVFDAGDARVSVPLIRWYPQQPPPARFDEPQAAPVAVINETMARLYWPNQDAVGKRFRVLFSPWVRVVGVVADARQAALVETPAPEMFLSATQEPMTQMTLVVRSTSGVDVIAGSLTQQIHAFDKSLPVGAITPMEQVISTSIGRPRFNVVLLGAAGAIALVLALLGIYGVLSYSVARRTREMGIRRALGAPTMAVLQLVLGQALALVASGVVIGVGGALALTHVLDSLLYDVAPNDPMTFASVAALVILVALLAGYLPSRRAARIDPGEALRVE